VLLMRAPAMTQHPPAAAVGVVLTSLPQRALSFPQELARADRLVILETSLWLQAREDYARLQQDAAKRQIPLDPTRLDDYARDYHRASARLDEALEARALLIDDRMQSHVRRLVERTGLTLTEPSE
jgi:hypothetical protein